MHTRACSALLGLTVAIALGMACGGSGQGSPASLHSPSHSGVAVDVTARNLTFSRNKISVPAGKEVSIFLTSEDAVPHNIAIYTNEEALEELFVGETLTGPNETIEYYFVAPMKRGNYFFRCDVYPTSMTGQFEVE